MRASRVEKQLHSSHLREKLYPGDKLLDTSVFRLFVAYNERMKVSTPIIDEREFLQKLKITFFPNEQTGLMSYFVKRNYGNYLFFTHPTITNHLDFFISQGGVYKVFEFNSPFPQENTSFFKKLGASTVLDKLSPNPNYKTEVIGGEHFDWGLSLDSDTKRFVLIQGGLEIFFHDNFLENPDIRNQKTLHFMRSIAVKK